MKIHIRTALTTEAKYLTELAMASKSYWGYSAEFMKNCREELSVTNSKINDKTFYYQVAESNGKKLGFYALEKLTVSTIELEALFVKPAFIGKGIGKALINHAKNLALQLGAKTMVIQGDPNAIEFYLAAGAKQVGELESGSLPGRFLPLFEMDL
ncbi:MAG: GNAT family N-acetyltransferase [Marinicellaceae bacterium]